MSAVETPLPVSVTEVRGGRPTAQVAAGAFWSLGILIGNIMPIVFEALRQGHGLADGQLGLLGAAYVLGSGVATGTGPFWVRRCDARWVSGVALAAAAAAIVVVDRLNSAGALTAGWCLIGLAAGAAATPSFAALGDAANPVRTYSLALFGSTLLAAAVSFLAPAGARLGPRGEMLALAALYALALPFAGLLSVRRRGPHELGAVAGRSPVAAASAPLRRNPRAFAVPILVAMGGAVFTGVFMGGTYNFVGSLAAADGIDARAAGAFVAVGLLSSLLGSLLPSILGERASPTRMIGLSIALTTAAYPALATHSAVMFGVGFAMHGVFSTLAYAYFLAVVRERDLTDRIYVAYPALQSLGIAAGAGITGEIMTRAGAPQFLALAAVANLLAYGLLIASRVAARAATETVLATSRPPQFGSGDEGR